jgi:hypothetical protein
MTLGGAAAARVRFIVWCLKCPYQVEPATASLRAAKGGTGADPAAKLLTEPSQMASPAEMARGYGPETLFREWRKRLVSSRCGSRHTDMVLCRHSMELSIKQTIVVYAESAGEAPLIEGHSLAQLWNELLRQIKAAGFEIDDEWTVYYGNLVQHLHDVDPDGERFRYPTSRKGVAFNYTEVDLRGLAVAHWHVGVLCDGAIGMLDGLGRQSSKG